jgi:hypothetical protein
MREYRLDYDTEDLESKFDEEEDLESEFDKEEDCDELAGDHFL